MDTQRAKASGDRASIAQVASSSVSATEQACLSGASCTWKFEVSSLRNVSISRSQERGEASWRGPPPTTLQLTGPRGCPATYSRRQRRFPFPHHCLRNPFCRPAAYSPAQFFSPSIHIIHGPLAKPP